MVTNSHKSNIFCGDFETANWKMFRSKATMEQHAKRNKNRIGATSVARKRDRFVSILITFSSLPFSVVTSVGFSVTN